jgi:NADPH-dependent 2,4-dienoyl-CoA reductase/sulfur reductase-like enzyme
VHDTAHRRLLDTLDRHDVKRLQGRRVVAAQGRLLLLESAAQDGGSATWLDSERLVLCTGARELQLPFPGWTLPGVTGAGGLQLMVKGGLSSNGALKGRRVAVAGTGPLLLAAAATAKQAGAEIVLLAEQAPTARVHAFARQLWRWPDRLLQAGALRASLLGTPYRLGTRIVQAVGESWVRQLRLVDAAGRSITVACDYLAVGHSLVTQCELPQLFGCALTDDDPLNQAVQVDELGATSVPGIFAAGETAGVGGRAKALIEGRIAGLAAAGATDEARALLPQAERERAYARLLRASFAPRLEESPQPAPDTLVCRCEDVPWAALSRCTNARQARLQQRCGMGHCQGRVCGSALSLLKGWPRSEGRPPLMPARVGTLARLLSPSTSGDSA